MAEDPRREPNRAAVIACRVVEGRPRIALITATGGDRWVIPKGRIESGERPRQAAGREALEEAGLLGRISDEPIGRFSYRHAGDICDVEVFLMTIDQAQDEWEESHKRTRRWMTIDEAAEAVSEPALAAIIRRVPQLIAAHPSDDADD
jgi:8-oxo-dGTP pyrophosphatase MutT (NUDIX family)